MLKEDNPIQDAIFPDVRQSMMNGGGPACLRLRVAMNDSQLAAINQNVRFSDELEDVLTVWIHKHYRDEIVPNDLLDPALYDECLLALEELEEILGFDHGVIVG